MSFMAQQVAHQQTSHLHAKHYSSASSISKTSDYFSQYDVGSQKSVSTLCSTSYGSMCSSFHNSEVVKSVELPLPLLVS